MNKPKTVSFRDTVKVQRFNPEHAIYQEGLASSSDEEASIACETGLSVYEHSSTVANDTSVHEEEATPMNPHGWTSENTVITPSLPLTTTKEIIHTSWRCSVRTLRPSPSAI